MMRGRLIGWVALTVLTVMVLGGDMGTAVGQFGQAVADTKYLKGTKWKGKLYQKPTGYIKGAKQPLPDVFDSEIEITYSRGTDFKATLKETSDGVTVTFNVIGTITPANPDGPDAIVFTLNKDQDLPPSVVIPNNVTYTGTIGKDDKRLAGDWKDTGDVPPGEKQLEGWFRLDFVAK
jgi:hypothetical protein